MVPKTFSSKRVSSSRCSCPEQPEKTSANEANESTKKWNPAHTLRIRQLSDVLVPQRNLRRSRCEGRRNGVPAPLRAETQALVFALFLAVSLTSLLPPSPELLLMCSVRSRRSISSSWSSSLGKDVKHPPAPHRHERRSVERYIHDFEQRTMPQTLQRKRSVSATHQCKSTKDHMNTRTRNQAYSGPIDTCVKSYVWA